MVNSNTFIPDVPLHPDPLLRQSIKQNITHEQNSQNEQNISPNINFDFKENSPFQEGIMSKPFQRLDKSFFQNPKELGDLLNKGNFIHKCLPKQMNIDKILEVMQRKVLKGTHLPMEVNEIQAGYLCSPYFKDIYLLVHLYTGSPPTQTCICSGGAIILCHLNIVSLELCNTGHIPSAPTHSCCKKKKHICTRPWRNVNTLHGLWTI